MGHMFYFLRLTDIGDSACSTCTDSSLYFKIRPTKPTDIEQIPFSTMASTDQEESMTESAVDSTSCVDINENMPRDEDEGESSYPMDIEIDDIPSVADVESALPSPSGQTDSSPESTRKTWSRVVVGPGSDDMTYEEKLARRRIEERSQQWLRYSFIMGLVAVLLLIFIVVVMTILSCHPNESMNDALTAN
jgi:hypothetical protein